LPWVSSEFLSLIDALADPAFRIGQETAGYFQIGLKGAAENSPVPRMEHLFYLCIDYLVCRASEYKQTVAAGFK
jgi:hypothetical protein